MKGSPVGIVQQPDPQAALRPLPEMNYHYLAERSSRDSWCDGEVQIFADYRDRVSAAVQAREEILSYPKQPMLSETLQENISRRRDRIKHQKRRARQRCRLK